MLRRSMVYFFQPIHHTGSICRDDASQFIIKLLMALFVSQRLAIEILSVSGQRVSDIEHFYIVIKS